ncbi:FAD-binding oxidoreductase [Haloglycomyces albus]|uniref:FAD-binding oxidoreductase n=1 Tax=Haloglycomyces albus TaxID=526067 RepID=UPI00046D4A84|nr:FAD-binding oxidoreductase [Haloglycomyces albus]
MSVTITKSKKKRPSWHKLNVSRIRHLTADSVEVTLHVPEELRPAFAFQSGQHLTFQRLAPDGTEIRRSYSIASTPAELERDGSLRMGIKSIPTGSFSNFANRQLTEGETLEVMPPMGHFTTDFESGKHYASVVAGSGITPIISIATTALETGATVTLLYSNRSAETVMYDAELRELKETFGDRLRLHHIRTREETDHPLLSGRLTPDRMRDIFREKLIDPDGIDEWFLCGPYELVLGVKEVIEETRSAEIHTELYYVD